MKKEIESTFPPKNIVGKVIPPLIFPVVWTLNYPLIEFLLKDADDYI
jgi:hypothetical protein